MTEPRRLVVGITGATGIAYGIRVLELARDAGMQTHLVVTPAGQQTRTYETDLTARAVGQLGDQFHKIDRRIEAYRSQELQDPQAHDLVIRAVDCRAITPIQERLS